MKSLVPFSPDRLRILFYTLWLASLFVQAYLVELQGDEAYYWRYSHQLAWGYFDHPPVTAVLAKLGFLIFQNELGVRLFFILAGAGTIWIVEQMIQPTDLKLFYAIVASVAFLQIGMVFGGGMYAIPDFPLLLFTALFFFLYDRYLRASSATVVIALALVISLLMLSKYHGILVVGFTVLSNLSLLKRKSFWLIVLLSLIGLVPHINWQVLHDFPSMKYHLFERSSKGYSLAYTYEYLLSQPFVLGPFISLLLIYAGFAFRPKNELERSMKFLIIGTYVFFFIMTFKGSVEGNWTVIALVPLAYVGYNYIHEREKLKKLTWYAFAISVPLILFVRVAISGNFIPDKLSSRFFGARRWTAELRTKAGDRPAVFMNSYQRAAQYEFYTGIASTSLNNVWGRKNQFTTWDNEAELQGKNVVMVANVSMPSNDSIKFLKEHLPYLFIDNFRSTSNIAIVSDLVSPVKVTPGDSVKVAVKLRFKNEHVRELEANAEYPSYLSYSFFQNAQAVIMQTTNLQVKNSMLAADSSYSISVVAPMEKGEYDFYLSVTTGWLPPGINSEKIKFIVE